MFPDFRQIKRCDQSLFYEFSLNGPVDETGISHRIKACSSFGPDFSMIPSETMRIAAVDPVDVDFEGGWWEEGYGLATSGIKSIVKQVRKYANHGHGAVDDKPFIIYGQSGAASLGIYIGQGLLSQGLTESALKVFEDNLANFSVSALTLAMQLCQPEYAASHIFGVMVTSNGTFGAIQTAVKSWINATCLSFADSTTFAGMAQFIPPLLSSSGANRSATPPVSRPGVESAERMSAALSRSTRAIYAGTSRPSAASPSTTSWSIILDQTSARP